MVGGGGNRDNDHHIPLGKTKLEVKGQLLNMYMDEIVVWCYLYLIFHQYLADSVILGRNILNFETQCLCFFL